ncbi:TonB-dependent siderophore receptor [Sphaerospermopsis sp. LEGE 08334]|uniref:TonB-dependent receptor plug domain-containing protein n=1 Tax=Sphaerospermopsis sp. LEGE 08334 TaxID=1828651 RepID=UPI00187E7053|nr:TonB-dependent receptor [Sphaerospermopsis sp. LEGE 08334]MBE9055011.1 TonB-dependent receptor [Sphaerospermopsis sp. LEGE 08334]
MQTNLTFFNSNLLIAFFLFTAIATPAAAKETEEKGSNTITTTKSESQIPNLQEINIPHTSTKFLTQDTPENTEAENTEAENTEAENTEVASQEGDIELDVVGTPLVNFIEERQQSPTGVIILDQREIQRFNYRTVGEVLRRQPGVVLGGPPGEDKDVRLLGLPKEYTQILINGQRFPDGGENREFKVDRIPVSLVERIEIISNPTATQNSQGVAGTVNIILKKAPDGRVADLTVSGTTLESKEPFGGLSLLYGDKQGDFSYLLSAGIQQREAPKNKFKQTLDLQNRPTQTERETESKSLLDISIAPNLVWRISPQDTLSFEPFFLRTTEEKDATRNIDNQKFFSPSGRLQELKQDHVNLNEDKTITGWRLGGHWEHELSATSNMKLGLFFQKTDETKSKIETINSTTTTFRNVDGSPINNTRNTTNIKREEEKKSDQDLFATLGFNFRPWENHKVTVGIEGSLRDREKKKISTEQEIVPTLKQPVEKTGPKDIYTIEENQLNIFVQDEIRLGEKHTLTAGLRMETIDNKATAGDSSEVKQSGTVFNPSLHYKYLVTPTTVFRTSLARTVRRPKFDDLIPFRDSKDGTLLKPDNVGNPNLKPETSLGIETGIEQSWGNNTGAFGVNAFYRSVNDKIENEINLNPENNRFEQSPRNVGDGKIYGLRLDAQTRTPFLGLPNLTLFGNVSFLGSEVEDKKSGEIRRFKEQPSYVANLGFDYTIPNWGMNFGLTYNILPGFENRELKDGKTEVTNQAGENSLDAYLAFRLTNSVQMSLFGKNLLAAERSKDRSIFNAEGVLENLRIERETAERLYGISLSWQF